MPTDFVPKHVTRSYSHDVAAPAERVFPLLCPTRELDWVPGWSCTLVHSQSGYAELGCVFTRDTPIGESTWVVCRFEPARLVRFVIVVPNMMVQQLEVVVEQLEGQRCRLTWTRMFTSMSEHGNLAVDHASGADFDEVQAWLGRALDAYCRTGAMIDEPRPAHRH